MIILFLVANIILLIIVFYFISIKHLYSQIYEFFEPYNLFVLSFTLYTLIGGYYWYEYINLKQLSMYYISFIVAIMSFTFGYISNVTSNDVIIYKYKIRNEDIIPYSNNNTFLLFIFIICIFINRNIIWSILSNFGSGVLYSSYAIRNIDDYYLGLKSTINSYSMNYIIFFLFFIAFSKKRLYMLFMSLIFLMLLLVYFYTSGKRTNVILILMVCFYLINYKYKKINYKLIVAFLISSILLLSVNTHLRAVNNIIDMYDLFVDNIGDVSYVLQINDVNAAVSTYFKNIDHIFSYNGDYNFGYIYFVNLLLYIPRFLFPNRPLPWPEQYMNKFYPEAQLGTGHGWYILNDGFISFGLLGIFIEMYLYGKLLSYIYFKYIKHFPNPYVSFMYIILNFNVVYSVRSEISLLPKTVIIAILPIYILYVINKYSRENYCV